MDLPSSTRRSFMKKTTALAVGISATTLFSGLVYAQGTKSACLIIAMDTGCEFVNNSNTGRCEGCSDSDKVVQCDKDCDGNITRTCVDA